MLSSAAAPSSSRPPPTRSSAPVYADYNTCKAAGGVSLAQRSIRRPAVRVDTVCRLRADADPAGRVAPDARAGERMRVPLGRHAAPGSRRPLRPPSAGDEAAYFTLAVIVMNSESPQQDSIIGPGVPRSRFAQDAPEFFRRRQARLHPGRREVGDLIPEPDNPWDRNAVAVYIDGRKVGYLPRETSAAYAALLSQLGEHSRPRRLPCRDQRRLAADREPGRHRVRRGRGAVRRSPPLQLPNAST